MAAASKSPSTSANNSSQSRRPSAARGVLSPPGISFSENVDQEQSVTLCYPSPSDTVALGKILDASGSLSLDDSPVVADAQFENSKNGGAGKKPAWKKPSKGAASVVAEVGAVMGAESWPALSESARASPKPSLVSLNGPVVKSEEMPPVSLSPQKRPTSMLGAFTEAQQHNAGNSGGSAREYNGEGTVSWQRPFAENEQHSQNDPLRTNNGPRPDGFQHQRHGGRRDTRRMESFTSRKRDGPRPFVRGPALPNGPFTPPPNGPFAPPPNGPFGPPPMVMPHYVNPMIYHELPHVYYVPSPHLDTPRPMHMVSYLPVFTPPSDLNLSTKILNQIDYYFSNENLVRDTFLRRNMDSEGWVSLDLISRFTKVKQLTDNIHLIKDAIQASNIVELQDDKVRCKIDWNKWLMPRDQSSPTTSHSIHVPVQE